MPTFFGDDDIAAIMADEEGFGVPVVFGAYQGRGIVDYVGKDVLQSMGISGVSATAITVDVQTSAFPGLTIKSVITVDGVQYSVRDRQQVGDGAETHLLCTAVS